MDYLTSFSQLFDCLLVLVCLSGNFTVFRLLDVFLTIWLSFQLSDCLPALRLSFDYLTIFRPFICNSANLDCLSALWLPFRLFDSLLTIWLSFSALQHSFGYLTLLQLYDCVSFISAILSIWPSFRLFDCLLAIWLSFRLFDCLWLFDCLFS